MAAAIVSLGIFVPAAGAEMTAETMYRPATVDVIRLTLPPASVAKLEAEPEAEYVEGTFSLAETEGTPQTVKSFTTPITVGVRLKGSLGSLRSIHEKAAFKIKLNWVKGQKFAGLKKMTLNNMVQDPSMVHETMAYELFRANHVPATNTGFAYLYVNGEDFGMHLNVETIDQEALEKRFGPFAVPPQHLYEGEYGADVTTSAEGKFEVDEGEEGDRSDLEGLVAAVEGTTPPDFSERVSPHADLQEMVDEWAVEKYIGHWDGYAGQQGYYWPNNYYLYSSAAGVFQMLPWGTDQTWGDRLGFEGAAGVLFDKCLEDQSCKAMYLRALRELLASLPSVGLDSLATRTAALLEPWQALEESPRRPYGAQQIHEGVESTRAFAASRPAELESFLAGGPGEAVATHIAVAVDPSSVVADGSSTATASATVTGTEGEPVAGADVTFSSSDPGERLGPVTYRGEGIYTATVTASDLAGTPTITATDASAEGLSGSTTLVQTAGAPTHLELSLQPSSIVADGVATATATATVLDTDGNPVSGQDVVFSSSDPGEQVGATIDDGDGTYTATITSSTALGTATISATDASSTPVLTQTASLAQTPGAPTHLELSLQPSSVIADGDSTTTATVRVTDAAGHPLAGRPPALSSSDPAEKIGAVVDHGDGSYSAQVTASTTVGTVTITAVDAGLLADATLQQLAPVETRPPVVTITAKPSRLTNQTQPLFAFVADEQGSTFECKVDGGPYRPCASPDRLSKLGFGLHYFQVLAKSQAGRGAAAVYLFFIY